MTINPLALQAPGRNAAFSLPSPGEVALPADFFASLLGLQMGTKLAAKPVLDGVDPDVKPLKPQKGDQADVALFLYGAAPAALPVHAVNPQVLDSPLPGGVDEVLDLTQEMLAASRVAGGKKLPHEERQLLQFLPDGSPMTQTMVRAAEAGQGGQQVVLTVNTPLAPGKAWGEAFSGQVAGLIQMKAEGATIKLNPAHLGPIEVSLKLSQDQAQISFVAATPQARDALEQNLSRLTSMLAESGVQLTDAQVSYGGRQQQQEQQARRSPVLGDEELAVSVSSLPDDTGDAGLSIRA